MNKDRYAPGNAVSEGFFSRTGYGMIIPAAAEKRIYHERVHTHMMKMICILLTLCLMTGFSLAEGYSSMTDQELLREINLMRNELLARDLVFFDGYVLYDGEGIRMYIDGPWTGKGDMNYRNEYQVTYTLPVILINSSENDVVMAVDSTYINGWKGNCNAYLDVKAGKKARGRLEVVSTELTEEDVGKGPEEIELDFCFINGQTYKRVTELTTVTIVFPYD